MLASETWSVLGLGMFPHRKLCMETTLQTIGQVMSHCQ